MVGWHQQLNGNEFEQTLGDSEGQGILACCSPWGGRVGNHLGSEQQKHNDRMTERGNRHCVMLKKKSLFFLHSARTHT